MRMKKEINLTFATAVMTGCIIGSGVFVAPTSIVQHTGSVGMALVMWAVSGVISTLVVLCYAELGSVYPKAGGEYNFYYEILGPLPAFLIVWIYVLVILPAVYALYTLTATNYMFYHFYENCPPPGSVTKIVSVWITVSLVALNTVYVKYVTRVQTFFTAIKVLTLGVIIVTGFVQMGMGKTAVLKTGFDGTTGDPGGIAIAMYSGFFNYSGWQYLFILLEEVKRPEKVVPRATIISMTSVIGLYLLTNIAYFTVMTPEEMMASPVVAVTFAERTLGKFSLVVPLLVACSSLGALNGSLLGGSRMGYAAARDGMFPSVLGTIHLKYLTPWASLWFLCVLSIVYVVTGEAVSIIEYLGFFGCLTFIVSLYCVMYLRWKQPHMHRPIKMPLPLVIVLFLVCILLTLMGLYKQPKANGIGVLMIISGVPAYWFGVCWKNKPPYLQKTIYKCYISLQKALMSAGEDKEE